MNENALTFQDMILALEHYWADKGCTVMQPYDSEVGAGTFHTATTLRSLGPAAWRTCYPQPCRRPADGRYGENPNRMQHYYQFQVILKPCPTDSQDLYLGSLTAIGLDPADHDVRFVEDDWESPTLGAWGLGWEVWMDGMEVTQYTYFQQVGGIEVDPVPVEITYGLERIAMYAQGVDSVYDLVWSYLPDGTPMTYGDVFHENEVEFSAYNFEVANVEMMRQKFDDYERECHSCLERKPSAACLRLRHEVQPCLPTSSTPARHLGHRACQLHPARPQHGQGLLRVLPRRGRGQVDDSARRGGGLDGGHP